MRNCHLVKELYQISIKRKILVNTSFVTYYDLMHEILLNLQIILRVQLLERFILVA